MSGRPVRCRLRRHRWSGWYPTTRPVGGPPGVTLARVCGRCGHFETDTAPGLTVQSAMHIHDHVGRTRDHYRIKESA